MSTSRSYDFAADTAKSIGVNAPRALFFAPATALYTLPFSAYLLCLSQRVVYARKKTNTFMGSHSTMVDGQDPLYVAIRAHGNFLETAPIGLMLALCAELNGASRRYVGYALAVLLGLRVANVEAGLARKESKGVGSTVGYYGTQAWLLGMSAYCVLLTREFWGF